jgi:carbon-monoxide dehydrogenase large subunit/6-hydroxypseudooxynicotine dehydrogenase subunit gamma
VALALDRDGRFLGLDATLLNDMGAYLHVTTVPTLAAAHLPGPYRIPSYRCRVSCVMTNKAPTATLRGPGLYESNFVRERIIDMAALELGMDPVELRRLNLIQPHQMPYSVGTDKYGVPTMYDAGNFPAVFQRALETVEYGRLRDEARAENAAGSDIRVGVGLACLVEPSGWGPLESAKVQVTPAGKVRVYTGATSQGQGQETTLAQVCAEVLRLPLDDVTVCHGDTALMPFGQGTHASRSAVMAGSAVHLAALKLKEKILRAAAARLEVSPVDLRLEDGRVSVTGMPSRGYSLREVAGLVASPATRAGDGAAPGSSEVEPLEVLHYHTTTHDTSAFAVHVAVVAVDMATGVVRPRRYAVVCDVGRAINPMIVEGQLVGGVIQGLGGALLEELVYDESGQPLTTSFLDYLVPSATESPAVRVTILEEARAETNPLGVKGVGELGTSGAGAALANAVADALGQSIGITALPLSPDRLHALFTGSSHGSRLI